MVACSRIRAFTPIEVVVVVLLCLFLLLVLPPVTHIQGGGAFRMTCGTNLAGIGKAMLIYANDYEDELPRAGGRNSIWGPVANWQAQDRYQAYRLSADGSGGNASITSCFYLLVKYSEVTPKSFICTGDVGATEFRLAALPRGAVPRTFELIDAWDFGPASESLKHCSYSYHVPFGPYALTTSAEPGFAVAADRNPWIDSPFAKAQDFSRFKPGGTNQQARLGNSVPHHQDGQNVLFLDSHVEFAKRPYCALEDDNIYTISGDPTGGDPWGTPPKLGSRPANRKDSLLVNDPPASQASASRPISSRRN